MLAMEIHITSEVIKIKSMKYETIIEKTAKICETCNIKQA